MKISKVQKIDLVILCRVIPVVVIGLNIIFFGKRYFTDREVFFWATLASGFVGLFTWVTHTWATIYLREKLTGLYTNKLRVLYSYGVLVLMTVLVVIGTCWIYHATHFLGFMLDSKTFLTTLSFGLVMNIIATSFNEGAISSEKWNKAALEAEQLKREALQRELDHLKSQVNPHFYSTV